MGDKYTVSVSVTIARDYFDQLKGFPAMLRAFETLKDNGIPVVIEDNIIKVKCGSLERFKEFDTRTIVYKWSFVPKPLPAKVYCTIPEPNIEYNRRVVDYE